MRVQFELKNGVPEIRYKGVTVRSIGIGSFQLLGVEEDPIYLTTMQAVYAVLEKVK